MNSARFYVLECLLCVELLRKFMQYLHIYAVSAEIACSFILSKLFATYSSISLDVAVTKRC